MCFKFATFFRQIKLKIMKKIVDKIIELGYIK